MIKFRHFLLVGILAVLVYACEGDGSSSTIDNFDHAAQALKDNDSLVGFLKNHYYDANDSIVKPLVTGQTALFDDAKLMEQDISENDIDYKLYYYVAREGTPIPVPTTGNENPSVVDSVFVNYSGQRIVNTENLSVTFDSNTNRWFALSGVIKGWSYGFANFKGGELKREPNGDPLNGPITYINGGKGVLFIPSGLAYTNRGNGAILPNEPLLFYIDLFDFVPETDIDQDGVASIFEDIDGDGKPWNDDTDGDLVPNLFDTDDDGDGILTINEDANGDGNPRNDFSDPENPTLPDYLNIKIR